MLSFPTVEAAKIVVLAAALLSRMPKEPPARAIDPPSEPPELVIVQGRGAQEAAGGVGEITVQYDISRTRNFVLTNAALFERQGRATFTTVRTETTSADGSEFLNVTARFLFPAGSQPDLVLHMQGAYELGSDRGSQQRKAFQESTIPWEDRRNVVIELTVAPSAYRPLRNAWWTSWSKHEVARAAQLRRLTRALGTPVSDAIQHMIDEQLAAEFLHQANQQRLVQRAIELDRVAHRYRGTLAARLAAEELIKVDRQVREQTAAESLKAALRLEDPQAQRQAFKTLVIIYPATTAARTARQLLGQFPEEARPEDGIRITNRTEETLVYEARKLDSDWQTFRLPSGRTHTFRVKAPLMYRRRRGDRLARFTLMPGTHSEFRVPQRGGSAQLFKARILSVSD